MEPGLLEVNVEHNSPTPGSTVPDTGVRPSTRGSASNINWLNCNRHVTEKQLFAHVTSEMQSLLAAAARGNAPAWPDGRDAGLRHHGRKPATTTDFGYVEIFPRNATETPALLASIERNIAAATYDANAHAVPHHRRAGPPAASSATADSGGRDSGVRAPGPPGASATSSNAAFHIHCRGLDEFMAGFPTYMPLMREIKRELDGAVNDAVRCATENVNLRRQSTEARRARAAAVEEAYKKAAIAAGDFRRSVHKRLIALEERQIDAQRRTAAVRARGDALGADIAAARAAVARLLQTNQRLRRTVKAEEEWPRGSRATLAAQTLGQMERAYDPDAAMSSQP